MAHLPEKQVVSNPYSSNPYRRSVSQSEIEMPHSLKRTIFGGRASDPFPSKNAVVGQVPVCRPLTRQNNPCSLSVMAILRTRLQPANCGCDSAVGRPFFISIIQVPMHQRLGAKYRGSSQGHRFAAVLPMASENIGVASRRRMSENCASK
jgi:hypothetical protein